MVKRYEKRTNSFKIDSIIIASFTVCLLFYGNLFPSKPHYFAKSLSSKRSGVFYGKIISSPVKNSSNDFYKADFDLSLFYSEKGEVFSELGTIQILLPSSEVEAFYPGKLWTQSSFKDCETIILDEGREIAVKGCLIEKQFLLKGEKISDIEADKKFRFNQNLNQEKYKRFFHENRGSFFSVLFEKINSFRSLCRLKFRRLMFSWGEAGALFLALISGIREFLNEDISDGFRKAGLSHILALSGMHLSLFSSISLKAGRLIAGMKRAFLFQIAIVLLFVWFAGISPSLFRALISMLLLIFFTKIKIFQINQLRILCLSFLIHVSIFPFHMFMISFMLSYGALLGILLLGGFFTSVSSVRFPSFISNSFGSSSAAVSFTSPITIIKMNSFSPIGILSTLFVSPLITIFIYSGMLLFALSLCFPATASCNAIFIQFQYNIIKSLINIFSSVSFFN